MHPLTLVTLAAYATTAALHVAYVVGLSWRRHDDGGPAADDATAGHRSGAASGSLQPWALGGLALAVGLHFVDTTARGLRGLHPATDAAEAISFLVLVLVLAYGMAVALRRPLTMLGAVVTPLCLALLGTARLSRLEVGATPAPRLDLLGRLHISFATAGVAAFGLAAAAAVFYLFQQRQLRQHRVTPLARRGASLQTLDRLSQRAISVGFPVFTVAMVTGAWWLERIPAPEQGPWVLRPEHVAASVAWLTYAALLGGRAMFGWRGRKAAWLTVGGFGATVVVLGGYLTRAHGG